MSFFKKFWPILIGMLLLPQVRAGDIKPPWPTNAYATPAGLDFFEKQIRPLLASQCYECHSTTAGRADGGLRLDSRESLLRGGVMGATIVPGEPSRGMLFKTLADFRETSPANPTHPRHRLPVEQLADLAAWIQMGAPDPRDTDHGPRNTLHETNVHWAFQPLNSPAPPAVRNQRWPNNTIDRFILARIETAGLSPSLAADKRALIRRATFDLTGLPPAPEEIDAFLRDRSPRAYEKLVERLLASPHHGERWGRHWLDVARYADSSGDNSDFPIPQARFYRDYVITAFNQDKPYDQFLREQIAGDLLPAESAAETNEHLVATGFLALSRRFGAGMKETEHLTIEDTLETLGRAVLGLSMSCARCHDHKHDPISMQDYYALYGIFSSTRYPHPGSEPQTYQTNFVRLQPLPEIETPIKPMRDKLAAMDDELDRLHEQITVLEKKGLSTKDLNTTYDKLDKEADNLAVDLSTFDTAYAVAEDKPVDARVQKRGEPWNLGEEAPRGFLKILGGRKLPADCRGSGRLELAEWLTDAASPLTARVMVNRIWQHHFGRGLVETPSDFGTRGRPPTHPELLDHLARRFIESGWSVKAMHRLIMFSATYQQSSSRPVVGELKNIDSDNTLLTRFPRRRLDAEEIRDALLAVSGDLDPAPAGPHPFPPAHTWNFSQHVQFNAVYETRRRSVYLMQQRIKKHPFLAAFDGADANASTADRGVTTTPLQALFMMNDPFAHAQAGMFARRLLAEATDDSQRINRAHLLALGRPARPDEIREGLAYLDAFRKRLTDVTGSDGPRELQAWSSYARALLGSNEFFFVD